MKFRAANSGSALTMVMFLLCIAVFLPALWLRNVYQTEEEQPDEYVINAADVGLKIRDWHELDGLAKPLAQFDTVFWEPDDTASLRSWLAQSPKVKDAHILEIGTGTGLISLLCAQLDAKHVVATDINPNAAANARYNADHHGLSESVEVLLVDPDHPEPFSMLGDQRFDLIISNPPWEDAPVKEPAAYALYDPGFALLDGMLRESGGHLNPEGRLLLAYGSRTAIERILERAPEFNWQVIQHDQRELSSLPEVFLPGYLLELAPK